MHPLHGKTSSDKNSGISRKFYEPPRVNGVILMAYQVFTILSGGESQKKKIFRWKKFIVVIMKSHDYDFCNVFFSLRFLYV